MVEFSYSWLSLYGDDIFVNVVLTGVVQRIEYVHKATPHRYTPLGRVTPSVGMTGGSVLGAVISTEVDISAERSISI